MGGIGQKGDQTPDVSSDHPGNPSGGEGCQVSVAVVNFGLMLRHWAPDGLKAFRVDFTDEPGAHYNILGSWEGCEFNQCYFFGPRAFVPKVGPRARLRTSRACVCAYGTFGTAPAGLPGGGLPPHLPLPERPGKGEGGGRETGKGGEWAGGHKGRREGDSRAAVNGGSPNGGWSRVAGKGP